MKLDYFILSFIILACAGMLPAFADSATLTVKTDLSSYNQGDTIVVTGHVSQPDSSTAVNLRLFNSDKNMVSVTQLLPSSDGSFTKTFLATGSLWKDAGDYTLVVQYGKYAQVNATFHYNGGDGSSLITKAVNSTYSLQSGGQTWNIPYIIKGGTVNSMDILASQSALEVVMSTASDGSITITVPRMLIDAKQSNMDGKLNITVNGNQVTTFHEISNQNVWTLDIPFHNGDTRIDISGKVANAASSSQPTQPNPNSENNTDEKSLEGLLKQRMTDAQRLQSLLHGQSTNENESNQKQNESNQKQNEQEQSHHGIMNYTEQDVKNIEQAKINQTIAAEVNVGTNNTQTTSIDNNVLVQTTHNTPDSLGVQVSANNQTGPKVIVFNLAATTINVQNLKGLGVMYDGKPIAPAPNMDAILHAKPTDNPSFAIVVTQSGVQVLVLVPHFSTHTITITNMTEVIPAVPEFGPVVGAVTVLSIFVYLVMSRKFSI